MSSRASRKEAARAARELIARQRRRRRNRLVTAAAVAVLLAAGATGYAVYAAQDDGGGDFAVPATATADRAGLRVGDGPVTVEVYLDYLCPACRAFEQEAGSTIDRLVGEGRISVVYHTVAILDHYSTNRYSSRSAAGAGCAADAGRLTAYTNALYADQPAEGGAGHTDGRLADLAAGAGIPREPFAQCLSDGRYAGWVTHVTDEMARSGFNGTPTVLVDGQRLPAPTAAALTAAVELSESRL
ncbi:thioredoxin domain-containing protein [Phytohabitans sp. ZYX-F-186]|uniref:Thioredoxin domain-containing protein n=1 Tax=Phytohabitans maris TaxID=3071409 RepID=A0ABU0ZAE3_9ACTN|nr:thioredoxin domain-containing protein [Phytohabitans sp. ZYX-F-186]MDQ7904004.1 thioredoxin domain-containing protein [Phytohabitans sp. ZYX-F-186]